MRRPHCRDLDGALVDAPEQPSIEVVGLMLKNSDFTLAEPLQSFATFGTVQAGLCTICFREKFCAAALTSHIHIELSSLSEMRFVFHAMWSQEYVEDCRELMETDASASHINSRSQRCSPSVAAIAHQQRCSPSTSSSFRLAHPRWSIAFFPSAERQRTEATVENRTTRATATQDTMHPKTEPTIPAASLSSSRA